MDFDRGRQVANLSGDQTAIIQLLAQIAINAGGKAEAWGELPPLGGPDGFCYPNLAKAILDFQQRWVSYGKVARVDGVVDPRGSTLRWMDSIVQHAVPAPNIVPDPLLQIAPPPRLPGTWQITNVTSASLGEIGQVGACDVTIAQPDERQFTIKGWGAGFGVSLDPVGVWKMAKGVSDPETMATLASVAGMVAKGVGFNVGDFAQLWGRYLPASLRKHLAAGSSTYGEIYPSPWNGALGRPTALSRYMLAGGSRPPFCLLSGNATVGVGGELGMFYFGGVDLLSAAAIGFYGSAGWAVKAGAGIQASGLRYSRRRGQMTRGGVDPLVVTTKAGR